MPRDSRLVRGDHLGPLEQRVVHRVAGELDAADQLNEDVGIAGERFLEASGELRRFGMARWIAHQHRAYVEQVRLRLQQLEHSGADRAAAKQGDLEPLGACAPGLDRRDARDGGRFSRAQRRDLDQHVPFVGGVDGFGLDEPAARLLGLGIVEMRIAQRVGVLRRVLLIDTVDILDQPHAVGVEAVGEEDRAEVGAAATESDDAVLGVIGDKAREHDHVIGIDA